MDPVELRISTVQNWLIQTREKPPGEVVGFPDHQPRSISTLAGSFSPYVPGEDPSRINYGSSPLELMLQASLGVAGLVELGNLHVSRRGFLKLVAMAGMVGMSGCAVEGDGDENSLFSENEANRRMATALGQSMADIPGQYSPLIIQSPGNQPILDLSLWNQESSILPHRSQSGEFTLIYGLGSVLTEPPLIPGDNGANYLQSQYDNILSPPQLARLLGYNYRSGDFSTLQRAVRINTEIADYILHGNPDLGWKLTDAVGFNSQHYDTIENINLFGIGQPDSPLRLTHIARPDDLWHPRLSESHQLRHILGVYNPDTSQSLVLKIQPIEITNAEVAALKLLERRGVNVANLSVFQPTNAQRISISVADMVVDAQGNLAPNLMSALDGNQQLTGEMLAQLDDIYSAIVASARYNGHIPADVLTYAPHNIMVVDGSELVVIDATAQRVTGVRIIYNTSTGRFSFTGPLKDALNRANELYARIGRPVPTLEQNMATHIVTPLSGISGTSIQILDDLGGVTNEARQLTLTTAPLTQRAANQEVMLPLQLSQRAFTAFQLGLAALAVGAITTEFAKQYLSVDDQVELREVGAANSVRPQFVTVQNDVWSRLLNGEQKEGPDLRGYHTYAISTDALLKAAFRHSEVSELRESLGVNPGSRELVLKRLSVTPEDTSLNERTEWYTPVMVKYDNGKTYLSYMIPTLGLDDSVELFPNVIELNLNSPNLNMTDLDSIDTNLSTTNLPVILDTLEKYRQSGYILGYTLDKEGNLIFFTKLDDGNLYMRYVIQVDPVSFTPIMVNIRDIQESLTTQR